MKKYSIFFTFPTGSVPRKIPILRQKSKLLQSQWEYACIKYNWLHRFFGLHGVSVISESASNPQIQPDRYSSHVRDRKTKPRYTCAAETNRDFADIILIRHLVLVLICHNECNKVAMFINEHLQWTVTKWGTLTGCSCCCCCRVICHHSWRHLTALDRHHAKTMLSPFYLLVCLLTSSIPRYALLLRQQTCTNSHCTAVLLTVLDRGYM